MIILNLKKLARVGLLDHANIRSDSSPGDIVGSSQLFRYSYCGGLGSSRIQLSILNITHRSTSARDNSPREQPGPSWSTKDRWSLHPVPGCGRSFPTPRACRRGIFSRPCRRDCEVLATTTAGMSFRSPSYSRDLGSRTPSSTGDILRGTMDVCVLVKSVLAYI